VFQVGTPSRDKAGLRLRTGNASSAPPFAIGRSTFIKDGINPPRRGFLRSTPDLTSLTYRRRKNVLIAESERNHQMIRCSSRQSSKYQDSLCGYGYLRQRRCGPSARSLLRRATEESDAVLPRRCGFTGNGFTGPKRPASRWAAVIDGGLTCARNLMPAAGPLAFKTHPGLFLHPRRTKRTRASRVSIAVVAVREEPS
jgi:hypothetical protein